MFNEFNEKVLQEKLEAFQSMLQRSNDASKREGLEKKILEVRCELEFKIANREQHAINKRPRSPAKAPKATPNPVAVAASGAPAAPHARRQKVASDARAAADILKQKHNDALRKAEESRRHEAAVRGNATATLHDKRAAIDKTLADEEIARDLQSKVDNAILKADKKEADVRKAEAKAAAHQSNLSLADRQPSVQPLADSQCLQDGNGQTSETRIAQSAGAKQQEAEAEAENARLAEEAKQAEAENARLAEKAKQAEATAKAEDARLKAKAKQESKDRQLALWYHQLDQCQSTAPEFKRLPCDDGNAQPHVLVSNDVLDSASLSLAIAALAFTEELEGQFSIVTDTLQQLSRVTNQHGITCLQKPDTLIIPLLLSKDETMVAAVPAQEFEDDVDGYIHPSAQYGVFTSAEEQRRLVVNVRATNQSAREHIQLPQRPTEAQKLQAQRQWNQGRIGHYIVVIAERTPGSAKVKLSYMNSMSSYCRAYGEINEVRGLARTIVCNSGWMAGQKPQWLEEDWTPAALQGGSSTCGFHTILNTWAYMLGIKINVNARCTQGDYSSARSLINLALQGCVSSLEIEAWMQVHKYAAFKPSPQSRNVTSSAHSVRMNEHILEIHLDYLRDLESGNTCWWPAVPETRNQTPPKSLKRRQPEDFDENQRGNRRSRPSPSFPQPNPQTANSSDDESNSEFLANVGNDDLDFASKSGDSTTESESSDSESASGPGVGNNPARNDHNGHVNEVPEQSDPMDCVVLLVTRLSGKLDLVKYPGKARELAERRNQLWEAFQLYRPDLFNGSNQPRRLDLLLDQVSSGKGAVTFHTRHKESFPDLFSAPPTKIFAVGTAVDGYITDPLGLRLLVGLMPHHEWVLCLTVPANHKRKDVRTLFSSIRGPVRWGSWTFQLLIETAERLNDAVRPALVDARARELLSMWHSITVGKRGHAQTLLNEQGVTDGLRESDEYKALCPQRQRNKFPLLERSAGNVLELDETSADEGYDCQCLACRDIGYVRNLAPAKKGVAEALLCRFGGGCTFTTEDRDWLRNHEKTHYRKPGRGWLFRCMESGCTYSNTQWGELCSHSRFVHCTNTSGYPCPVLWCRKNRNGFHQKSKWLKHMHDSHAIIASTDLESKWAELIKKQQDASTNPPLTELCENPSPPFPTERGQSPLPPPPPPTGLCTCIGCQEVGARFKEDDRLTQKACRFPGCNKSTAAKDLVKHEQAHFRGADNTFECIETGCSYAARAFSDLRKHCKARHCVGPPVECPERGCSYSTTSIEYLAQHRRRIHGPKPDCPPIECPERGCSYSTRDSHNLGHHRRRMHPSVQKEVV